MNNKIVGIALVGVFACACFFSFGKTEDKIASNPILPTPKCCNINTYVVDRPAFIVPAESCYDDYKSRMQYIRDQFYEQVAIMCGNGCGGFPMYNCDCMKSIYDDNGYAQEEKTAWENYIDCLDPALVAKH